MFIKFVVLMLHLHNIFIKSLSTTFESFSQVLSKQLLKFYKYNLNLLKKSNAIFKQFLFYASFFLFNRTRSLLSAYLCSFSFVFVWLISLPKFNCKSRGIKKIRPLSKRRHKNFQSWKTHQVKRKNIDHDSMWLR
jgi:hypothetical protein